MLYYFPLIAYKEELLLSNENKNTTQSFHSIQVRLYTDTSFLSYRGGLFLGRDGDYSAYKHTV